MLRISDLMLIAGMLEQAATDAALRKSPPVVRAAIKEAHRRIKNVQLQAPTTVQVKFQNTFHRKDCVGLAKCAEYAKLWMERDGQKMDEETERGFTHLQQKLNAYIQDMDAAGEMQDWLNVPKLTLATQ